MKLKNNYWLFLIIVILVMVSCSDKGTNPNDSFYIPPTLIKRIWEQIDDPSSVGKSLEKLNQTYKSSKKMQTESVMIIYQSNVLYYWGDIERIT